VPIEVDEVIGPSEWACALINGDASGLADGEEAIMDRWIAKLAEGGWYVVSTKDDEEPWFTWNYRLYSGESAGPSGGDVLTYVVHRVVSK